MKKKFIIKASGEQQEFNIKKFTNSLKRCGASKKSIDHLAAEIKENPNLKTTKQIYKFAFKKLCTINRPIAARYNLKNALFEFGPTGFPFERFVSALFKAQGYDIELNQILKGSCVDHEIDVIATTDNHHFIIECKFHNTQGTETHLQIPLYVKARFEDLLKQWHKDSHQKKEHHKPYVITNTRFTHNAIQYGLCAGINLVSWSYPKKHGIKDMIDVTGLYPITALTTLSRNQKKQLLEKDFVLCRDVHTYKPLLIQLGLSEKKIAKIVAEAEGVCKI